MKSNQFLVLAMTSFLLIGGMSSCYDLTDMGEDPYALPNNNIEDGGDEPINPIGEYGDIDISYNVTDPEALAQIKDDLAAAPATFRNFLYEGYYNDYQITTNLTHDIYAGYTGNNKPNFVGSAPDYNYADGWSSSRWRHFYVDRCKEYASLLRAFKFSPNPERYINQYFITRIYFAFLALANTDTYGDMPFKIYASVQTPETNNVPYDTQADVYDGMFRMLRQAVDAINPDDASQYVIDTEDICYHGDAKKWLRFANTLRLRLACRISNIDPERAKQEAQDALSNKWGLMESNDDNMKTVPRYAPVEAGGINDGGQENVLAMCSVMYNGDCVMGWDLENYYRTLSTGGATYIIKTGRSGQTEKIIDPRCLICWYRTGMTASTLAAGEESLREDFKGCPKGYAEVTMLAPNQFSLTRTAKDPAKSKYHDPKSWFNCAEPTVWLGYAESLFLRAEAALRGWGSGNPEDLYRQGVQASMDYYEISATEAQSYINGLVALNDGTFGSGDKEKILEAIITQKWMAVFPNGNEGWAEFRRTDYPKLMLPLNNASGGDVPEGHFIKRLLYPNSENSNKAFTESDMPAKNSQGRRLWWDVSDDVPSNFGNSGALLRIRR